MNLSPRFIFTLAAVGIGSGLSAADSLAPGSASDHRPTLSQPLSGAPHRVPGRIQVEDFDLGAEGIAFWDSDARNRGNHKARGGQDGGAVDLQTSRDTDRTPNLGWARKGEWLNYTIHVTQSGPYSIHLRHASAKSTGAVQFFLNDKPIGGVQKTGKTGGWQNWETLVIPVPQIEAGQHILRLSIEGSSFNINWFEFALDKDDPDGNPESTPLSQPFHGSPSEIPGKIQVEDFDLGGSGVAFHDLDSRNNGRHPHRQGHDGNAVDLQSARDSDGSANLGWTRQGEWLHYTVSVTQAGEYSLNLRHASARTTAAVQFFLNDQPLSESLNTGRTGGWQDWETLSVPSLHLPAGEHQLRLAITGSSINVNWFEFVLNAQDEDEPAPPSGPTIGTGEDWSGQSLDRLNLTHTQAPQGNFANVYARMVLLDNGEFPFSRWDNAQILFGELHDSNFSGASFRAATFTDCVFDRADLGNADLTDGNFENSDFRGANLSGAIFNGANFSNTDLRGAIYDPSALREAITTGALLD